MPYRVSGAASKAKAPMPAKACVAALVLVPIAMFLALAGCGSDSSTGSRECMTARSSNDKPAVDEPFYVTANKCGKLSPSSAEIPLLA
jgi:hypothetical protein